MIPTGFWSYARGDDDHLDRMLTDLRNQIAGEVSMLMGADVGIFQDIHDLRTGDLWADKLRDGITEAAFLIPVLTPRFFNREWCREEVMTYLAICADKGVEPRIFPIRFVGWDKDETCDVRKALEPFQFKDFTQWRFESDPTRKSRMLNDFGLDVKKRLKVTKPAQPVADTKRSDIPQTGAVSVQSEAPEESPPPAPTYQTYIVDPFPGRGDFAKIGDAIAAAPQGSKIIVREGTYRENLHLSKALEITGEGDREKIRVVAQKGNALRCDVAMARISGMTFRREVGGQHFSVLINEGAVEIDDCIIESLSLAGMCIEGAMTSPTIQRIVFQNCGQGGLLIQRGARPVVEDCEFVGNALSGVEVRDDGTTPELRRCVSKRNKGAGFFFNGQTKGLLQSCEAAGNTLAGIVVSKGSDPKLRSCVSRGNDQSGIYVYEDGKGMLENCKLNENGRAGVQIGEGGAPTILDTMINGNGYQAIWIRDTSSSGIFRGNDLTGNKQGAWNIADGAEIEKSDNIE